MNPAEQQASLQDGAVLGAGAAPSTGPPQLPPQMFTTAAQLLDLTDKKLMLVLRDGRKLVGILRTWDQFANLVLTETKERYLAEIPQPQGPPRKVFCDVARGTFLVRGENVLLLGEIDLDRDDEDPPGYEEGPETEILMISKRAEADRKKHDKHRSRKAGDFWGGELEGSGEVLF